MKIHRIPGGNGVQLHVVETGNPQGRPVLFIHGFSQCGLVWHRQMNSDLAGGYRLVCMDLRGHGLSEKPQEGYGESQAWADDVHGVIQALGLDHPILCGWSYGPLVILDYLRCYGEDNIGGINIVGGVTKLGTEEAMAAITPGFLGLVPGFFSTDFDEGVGSLGGLIRLCFARELPPEEFYLMLGYNVTVPPYVRQGLLSRSIDNDELLPKVRKPVLITHGTEDAIVLPAVVEQHKTGIPHAQIQMIPNAGHAVFWEESASFNGALRAFADSL